MDALRRDVAKFRRGSSLRAMTDAQTHRGPDDSGQHVVDFSTSAVGFGHRRLSIIDPAGGRQPLFNEARDVVVLMNGELFNFRELRQGLMERGHRFRTGSDAEVLVHLYEERGERLVEQLVGQFAFALLDLRGPRPKLLLAGASAYPRTLDFAAFASIARSSRIRWSGVA